MLKKIVHQRQPADLGMPCRQIRICFCLAVGIAKNLVRSLAQLALPVRDLIRVNVILLRQLGWRLVALQRGKGHLRLECL